MEKENVKMLPEKKIKHIACQRSTPAEYNRHVWVLVPQYIENLSTSLTISLYPSRAHEKSWEESDWFQSVGGWIGGKALNVDEFVYFTQKDKYKWKKITPQDNGGKSALVVFEFRMAWMKCYNGGIVFWFKFWC